MKKYNLQNFSKGWFIGNFEPSLFSTDQFEVAVKFYKKGDSETSHHHKISTEYTIVNQWRFRMKDMVLEVGDIVLIHPNESTDFECLEDGSTTVVKIPCSKNDKYID